MLSPAPACGLQLSACSTAVVCCCCNLVCMTASRILLHLLLGPPIKTTPHLVLLQHARALCCCCCLQTLLFTEFGNFARSCVACGAAPHLLMDDLRVACRVSRHARDGRSVTARVFVPSSVLVSRPPRRRTTPSPSTAACAACQSCRVATVHADSAPLQRAAADTAGRR